ncbi:MAG: hypothetical protein RLZZ244_45 [Verrucomicrobiota bacterium]
MVCLQQFVQLDTRSRTRALNRIRGPGQPLQLLYRRAHLHRLVQPPSHRQPFLELDQARHALRNQKRRLLPQRFQGRLLQLPKRRRTLRQMRLLQGSGAPQPLFLPTHQQRRLQIRGPLEFRSQLREPSLVPVDGLIPSPLKRRFTPVQLCPKKSHLLRAALDLRPRPQRPQIRKSQKNEKGEAQRPHPKG